MVVFIINHDLLCGSWLYIGIFGGRSRLHRNQHIQWNMHCSSRLRNRTFGKSHN